MAERNFNALTLHFLSHHSKVEKFSLYLHNKTKNIGLWHYKKCVNAHILRHIEKSVLAFILVHET